MDAPTARRSILRRLAEPKSFMTEIALLMAGAGGAQAIVVATAPLLSRLYAPADFAGLSLLTSVVAIVSRVSSFKYETAISTGRNRPEMGALAAIATWVLFGFTTLSLIGAIAVLPLLEKRLGTVGAYTFVFCLPVYVLFDGLIQIVITWAVRWRQFKTVSANDLVRNGSSVLIQATAGVLRYGGSGLMLGQTIGSVIALFVLGLRDTLGALLRLGSRSSRQRQRAVARQYRDFPLYQMPKAILNALARNLPPVLITAYYSAQAAGLFWFAFRLTLLPANLVSMSVGRVLIQRFANLQNVKRQPLGPLLVRSTLVFAALGAPVVIVMALAGPKLFAFFLGRRWAEAGRMAIWTSLWSTGLIFGTPAQMSMTVQRRNRAMLVIEAIFLVPRLLPFPICAASGRIDLAVAICCASGFVHNVVLVVYALAVTRRYEPRGAAA